MFRNILFLRKLPVLENFKSKKYFKGSCFPYFLKSNKFKAYYCQETKLQFER